MNEHIILSLLGTPQWLLCGIVGALLGAASSLLPVESRRTMLVGVFILTFRLFDIYMDSLHKKYDYIAYVHELKKNRLVADAIRFDPSQEVKLRDGIRSLMAATPTDKLLGLEQQLVGSIVNDVFAKTIPSASDEAIHGFLEAHKDTLDRFQDRPSLCVEFFAGSDGTPVDPKTIPQDLMQRIIDNKARIMESASGSPATIQKAKDMKDFLDPLFDEYQRQNRNTQDLIDVSGEVSQLPPIDGCRAARSFIGTLATMDAHKASYIYKNWVMGLQE